MKQTATLLTFEHDSVLRWSLSHTSSNKNRNFLENTFSVLLKTVIVESLSLLTPNEPKRSFLSFSFSSSVFNNRQTKSPTQNNTRTEPRKSKQHLIKIIIFTHYRYILIVT